MEVEAKFTIPDRDTMDRLKRIVRLGSLSPGEVVQRAIQDSYFDTDERDLYQQGYTCRLRVHGDRRVLTIKGLGESDSAIHQRLEVDLVLHEGDGISPEDWPQTGVWGQMRSIVKDKPVCILFTVNQIRCVRPLRDEDRLVGELSIDDVQIEASGRRQLFWIAEVELSDDGTMDDLRSIVDHVSGTWGLVPQTTTKFRLGLVLLDQGDPEGEDEQHRLSLVERAQLEHIAEHAESDRVRKRAQLILGWMQRVPVRELAADVSGSKSWAYGWLKRFQTQGMAIFPADLLRAGVPKPAVAEIAVAGDATADAEVRSRTETTVKELVERFQVDVAHGRCVAEHALALFDATAEIHGLGEGRRRLLDVMGLLHNVGMDDPDHHHITGRDIILGHTLPELDEAEDRMLAAAVYLHRKRIKRKQLKADVVNTLPPAIREDTLVLAALLRIADGLDYSQGQTSSLAYVRATTAGIYVAVSGPSAEADTERARIKADLWDRLFDVPFFFSVRQDGAALDGERSHAQPGATLGIQAQDTVPPKSPRMVADDPMSEAGRKVLRLHFLRMLEHEPGTRNGADIEELHDMRVATRRMRAAFRVFASYYKTRTIRPFVAELRRTARKLGAVRDLDVLMQKAEMYLATLPPDRRQDLDPLLSMWATRRDRARSKMLAYLDSDKYRDLKEAFWLFLETKEAGVRPEKALPPEPVLSRHVVPILLYTRWAQVQAFGDLIDGAKIETLHMLRIECKRLRYALEFFQEILGSEAGKVIGEVVALQDHLGNLNDADVANSMLSEFLFGGRSVGPSERVIAPGVVSYLAVRQRELQGLVETFPLTWAGFCRSETKRWLADAIAYL